MCLRQIRGVKHPPITHTYHSIEVLNLKNVKKKGMYTFVVSRKRTRLGKVREKMPQNEKSHRKTMTDLVICTRSLGEYLELFFCRPTHQLGTRILNS